MKKIKLLDIESGSFSKNISSVSTLTFFQTHRDDFVEIIKAKFDAIVKANPWLCGCLRQDKRDPSLYLLYEELSDAKLLFTELTNVELSLDMPYQDMGKVLKPYMIKSSKHSINKQTKAASLTVIKTKEGYALLFSVSHTLVDGHSYYALLNMLSKDNAVYALNVQRKHKQEKEIEKSLGKNQYNYLTGKAHLFNALRGMLFSRKSKVFAFYVDDKKIESIKRAHCDFEVCDYLSNNDILTSSYGNFIGARLLLMAINFRKRLKGLSELDAGNYEAAILYDKKSYEFPYGIRESLSSAKPYRALLDKLPSFFEGLGCSMGLITNWSSFSKELIVENAKELLHLPLHQTSGKIPYEIAIIFRAQGDNLAIMYYTSGFTKEDFSFSELPLGDLMDDKIFSD